MSSSDFGFASDQFRQALAAATAGRPAELERLLAHFGAVLSPRPNFKLAAAFGTEVATQATPLPLLRRLSAEDAAPDTDRAFLPIAAAHGWAGLIRAQRAEAEAWTALAALAADERAPVRLGTAAAVTPLAQRPGGLDTIISHAQTWLTDLPLDLAFATAAFVTDLLALRPLVSASRSLPRLMVYLSAALEAVATAPRSAERSDARRRLLAGLPRALATVVAVAGVGESSEPWLLRECAEAAHTDVRAALSDAIILLRTRAFGYPVAAIEELRRALEASAKPLRDPTRVRPGHSRGKATRRTR